jgi:hypothetical protein
VFLHSFAEDGTVTVIVSGRFNHTMMERQVFGVHPDELKECDLPEPDEPLGVIDHGLSLDDMRVMVRPDLWVMRDGKAVRKQ